ncbi:MAG: phosphotransferase family protein [Candidatus Limnocylindrales bacterium]
MTEPASQTDQARDLLRRAPPARAIEWARRAGGGSGRVLSVERLRGGVSHANHLIRIDAGGAVHEVVLRRWVRSEWQETDPECSPSQEAATYDLLASSSVPAPRLIATDISATECDVPALLLARAPGRRVTRPGDMGSFLRQLARVLPAVHAVDPDRAACTVPRYRPYYERDQLDIPKWTQRPSLWQRAIEVATATPPGDASAFIHRDYHPGNTLWVSEKLTAIVDWTSASWGPPAVDLAHMRANLAISFGLEAAEAFLDSYDATVGMSRLLDPYWDVRAPVDFLPELPFEGMSDLQLARLEDFVAVALAAVGS